MRFIVLNKNVRRARVIKTDETPLGKYGALLVQKMESWGAASDDGTLHLYRHTEPELVDISSCVPWAVLRHCARKVDYLCPSDVSGCVDYTEGSVVDPTSGVPLMELPCATLIERLLLEGWSAGKDRRDSHAELRDKTFCMEPGFTASPTYFVCLLSLEELFYGGLFSLSCGQHDKYYQALLIVQDKEQVLPGLLARQYVAIMDGAPDVPPALPRILNTPAAAALPVHNGNAGAGAIEFEPEEDPIPVPVELPRFGMGRAAELGDASNDEDDPFSPERSPEQAPSDGEDTPAVSPAMAALVAKLRLWDTLPLPSSIAGVPAIVEREEHPTRGPPYIRKRVFCTNPAHGNCRRSRNLSFDTHFGQAEVFGYLGCWLAHSNDEIHGVSKDAHSRYRPSVAEVEVYLRERQML